MLKQALLIVLRIRGVMVYSFTRSFIGQMIISCLQFNILIGLVQNI